MAVDGIERRVLGRTGKSVSVLGFGGVIVTNTPQDVANAYVSEAFDRGINYFDVSPFYGNAQERLGPALKPYRDRCFLACKSRERTAAGLEADLHESLRLLQTDHVDLYQLHSLSDVENDVEAAFADGGAMEAVLRARDAGKIRHIGFSAHSEEAAHAAMDRFDFETVMFPLNYFAWTHGSFGRSVHERAREKGMGIISLKAIAERRWDKEEWKAFFRPWTKCWYRPLDDPDLASFALRFALNLPAHAAIPPGHWHLFKMCLEIVESGEIGLLDESERARLDAHFEGSRPLFPVSA